MRAQEAAPATARVHTHPSRAAVTLGSSIKFRIQTRAPQRLGLGAELAPGTKQRRTSTDNGLGFSAERLRGRSQGGRGETDTHAHTHSLLPHTPPLFFSSPKAQVGAAKQLQASQGVPEPGASVPPRKGPRPQGQLCAQGVVRTPGAPSPARPVSHGDREQGSSGNWPLLARARPSPVSPLPPGLLLGVQAASTGVPGDQPALRPLGFGQLPQRDRGLPTTVQGSRSARVQSGLTLSDVSLLSASAFGPEWPALGKEKRHINGRAGQSAGSRGWEEGSPRATHLSGSSSQRSGSGAGVFAVAVATREPSRAAASTRSASREEAGTAPAPLP